MLQNDQKMEIKIFHSYCKKKQQTSILSINTNMEPKYRCFPPAVPLKMSKLLEYHYLQEIYRKYDCNFLRQILPYFSEIVCTNKLELLKFIYLPIKNPHKNPGIQVGTPFRPQMQIKNHNFYQLHHEITSIKIAYQTHVIFEYLMNLSLTNLSLQRLKFQDKFWLFSEGIVKYCHFNDVVYRKDSRRQKGIIIFLEGEFICLNENNKPFKTVGKGYLIDLNGKLKKVNYDDKTKTDRISFDQSMIGSVTRQSQTHTVKDDEFEEPIFSVWSHSNSARILYISLGVIKKYCQNYDEQNPNNLVKIQEINPRPSLKPQFRSQLQLLKKNRKLKTQNEQLSKYGNGRKTFTHQSDSSNIPKKFNLISCRANSILLPIIPIEQVLNNEVIKSYTKDKELYERMKQMSIKRHRKFHSSGEEKALSIDRNQQLMPFFQQQLKDDNDKIIQRRRKTKQLWGSSSMDKQNFIANTKKLAEEVGREKGLNKSILKSSKLMKKIGKNELRAFQLLKRNFFNKEYHRMDFVQIKS